MIALLQTLIETAGWIICCGILVIGLAISR